MTGVEFGVELDDTDADAGVLLRTWLLMVRAVAVASIPPIERILRVGDFMTSSWVHDRYGSKVDIGTSPGPEAGFGGSECSPPSRS